MDRLRAYQVLSVVRSCVLGSPDKSHPWKPNVPWYTKLPKFGPHKIKIYTVYILYLLYTLYILFECSAQDGNSGIQNFILFYHTVVLYCTMHYVLVLIT